MKSKKTKDRKIKNNVKQVRRVLPKDPVARGKFLSMDLIERMVRVEQKVSASFDKEIPYAQTEYYKNLKPNERKEFEDYLKTKKRKKFLLGSFLFSILILLSFVGTGFTGNVINDFLNGTVEINFIENFSAILALSIAAVFLIVFVVGRRQKQRLDANVKILENAFLDKNKIRHLN